MTNQSEVPQESPTTSPLQMSESDERMWAMLSHLSALAGYFIPLGNIIGPLVIWLLKKDQSELVDANGKESLNFQISITIYAIVATILVFVIIGIPLLIALVIFDVIMIIVASVKANERNVYHYPLSIRLVN